MTWSEADQIIRKRNELESLLQRQVDRVHASPRSLGYRARVTLKINPDGLLGYHQPRSHTWLHVPACAIARSEINEVLERLPEMPDGLPALELRTDGQRVVLVARSAQRRGQKKSSPKANRAVKERLRELDLLNLGLAGVAFDGQPLCGDSTLRLSVCGINHKISPLSFYQVNLEVNEMLVQRVVEFVLESEPTAVLDLYSGIGNLSLPLAARGIETILMETAVSSAVDAQATISSNDLNARMIRGNAGRFEAGDVFFDVALLDPPRAGAPGVLPELLTTRPKMVIYVSCNPVTLARDIQPALDSGYELATLELIDMFPQTSHVETLCVLRRR